MTLITKNSKNLNNIPFSLTQNGNIFYCNLSTIYNHTNFIYKFNINELIYITKLFLITNSFQFPNLTIIGKPYLSNIKVISELINKEQRRKKKLTQFVVKQLLNYNGVIQNYFIVPQLKTNLKFRYNYYYLIYLLVNKYKFFNNTSLTLNLFKNNFIKYLALSKIQPLITVESLFKKVKTIKLSTKSYFILNKANLKLFERIKK